MRSRAGRLFIVLFCIAAWAGLTGHSLTDPEDAAKAIDRAEMAIARAERSGAAMTDPYTFQKAAMFLALAKWELAEFDHRQAFKLAVEAERVAEETMR